MTARFVLLIATLCVSRATGFAGTGPEIHAFLKHSAAIANSAVSSPFGVGLLEKYKHSLAVHPLEMKMITGATFATMGDAIAQSRQPEPYDKNRAASFMAFDAAYRALQHNLFPWIVKHCQGQFILGAVATIPALSKLVSSSNIDTSYFAAMEQTLSSQLGLVPFIYYPVFFALTGAVQGLSIEGTIDRAKENFLPIMERNLIFWIPVQFIQFGFIEENLQIPFLCICGLAWIVILSTMAGSTQKYKYCVTGNEPGCELPDELFPEEFVEEMVHGIGEMVHDVEEMVHDMIHDVENVAHDIEVALHMIKEDTEEDATEQLEVEKEKEEELMLK